MPVIAEQSYESSQEPSSLSNSQLVNSKNNSSGQDQGEEEIKRDFLGLRSVQEESDS